MDQFYTGADGKLLFDGRPVAKVRGWSLRAQIGTLPTTSLGDTAEDYTAGIKSGSGSCTIWYYADAPVDALRRIFRTDKATDADKMQVEFGWGEKKIIATVLFTESELSSQVGDAMSADCQFTVCGDLLQVNL